MSSSRSDFIESPSSYPHARRVEAPLFTFLQRTLRITLPALWGCGIVAGLWSLEHYKSLSGRAEAISPAVAHAALATGTAPRLVMYVHPHCPCTRASLAELAKLVADRNGNGKPVVPVEAEVVVVVAEGMEPTWRQGAITRAADEMIGVRTRTDLGAGEAQAVGAYTSGHTLLYAADGTITFRGGVTRSRGHDGDNAGTRAIEDLLNDRKPEVATTPVFGCPLFQIEPCESAAECRVANPDSSGTTTAFPTAHAP